MLSTTTHKEGMSEKLRVRLFQYVQLTATHTTDTTTGNKKQNQKENDNFKSIVKKDCSNMVEEFVNIIIRSCIIVMLLFIWVEIIDNSIMTIN